MIRFEATLDGETEEGEPFTNFDEVKALTEIFDSLKWQWQRITEGRGGYYLFNVNIKGKEVALHIYLKKLTFGGRESRPYEKRAQFSAALDRRGYDAPESPNEYKLILGIYKREKFPNTVICAWDIHEWGYNIGRAFNCFIDVRSVAEVLKGGFARYKSAAGQVACCFTPDKLLYYIQNKDSLHKNETFSEDGEIKKNIPDKKKQEDVAPISSEIEVPKFDDLFQPVMDVLRDYNRLVTIDEIEFKVIDRLQLPYDVWSQIHNLNEGYRSTLGYRLAWARFYLKKAGLIENPERGLWQLTELGKSTLIVDKSQVKRLATEKEVKEGIDEDNLNTIKAATATEEDADEVEAEDQGSMSEIEAPFDPNKVDIKTRPMSLDLILKRLNRGEMDMDTSFQRKAGLWNITKQSQLIESILIKLPLPAFYFDGSDDDKWLVVDGLQRISSLDNYVNKKSFALNNLEFLGQANGKPFLNGKKFHELPGNLQRRIEEFEITAYIIPPGTPKDLKYIVFKRINTGGLTLKPQEIRNAIYNGVPAKFVKKLAELPSFKQATNSSVPDDRMLDREFATRFLAFYLFSLDEYKSNLDSFLNNALDKLYLMSKNDLEKIEKDFDKAMQAAFNIFDKDAFRKRYSLNDKRKPINKASFEVWSVLLSKLNISQIDRLVKDKEGLKNKLIDVFNADTELSLAISTSTGDQSRVKKRFTEIDKIINSVINKL